MGSDHERGAQDPYPGDPDESGPNWGGYRHHWFRRWERPFGRPKERYTGALRPRADQPWLARLKGFLRGPRGTYG